MEPAPEAERLDEPYDVQGQRPFRPWALAAATLAAAVGAFVAPDAWPAGAGAITVELRGVTAIESPVTVGDTTPLRLRGEARGAKVTVELPDGIPVDAPVEAGIRVERAGSTVRPRLDALKLEIVLPGGARELVPAVRWDAAEKQLDARRRPPVDSAIVLALLGAVVVLWVTELFPLFVTSLAIPVVLVLSRVADAPAAVEPFFSPIIVLFFAGFLMAQAMRRTGLDRLAALSIVARAGRTPALLFAAMLCVAAFLSMWMSNTAAVAVLVPIAIAVTEPLHHLGYRKAVVLGIAYAGTIGGVGSAIGTPANQLAIEFLDTFAGRSISFVEWFAFGLPLVILFLPVMGVYLWWRSGVTVDPDGFRQARLEAQDELARLGRPTRDQWLVLAVFGGVVAGWLTQTAHGVHPGIVALAGAVVLAMLRKITPEDLGRISWASLLTFGGGLTLGLFLVETGTSDWVATRLTGLADVPSLVAASIVVVLALGLTTVASNTAAAAILIPLALPLAGVLGIDPVLLVTVVAIATSIDFALVIGTPPTLIAYSTGLYTAGRIFRVGIVLDAVGLLLLVTAVVAIWRLLGIV
ncbi:MAG: DASS family sodium-coupled anion symporter [Thermoleophilia bacterium]|nr:DASS family sodium-coupled anion symporter [Thermoleophilia bacterium]